MARTVEEVFETYISELYFNAEKLSEAATEWVFTYDDATSSKGRRPSYSKILDSANCSAFDNVEHLYFEDNRLAIWHFRDEIGLHIRNEDGHLLCNPRGDGSCPESPGPSIKAEKCKWCDYGPLSFG